MTRLVRSASRSPSSRSTKAAPSSRHPRARSGRSSPSARARTESTRACGPVSSRVAYAACPLTESSAKRPGASPETNPAGSSWPYRVECPLPELSAGRSAADQMPRWALNEIRIADECGGGGGPVDDEVVGVVAGEGATLRDERSVRALAIAKPSQSLLK